MECPKFNCLINEPLSKRSEQTHLHLSGWRWSARLSIETVETNGLVQGDRFFAVVVVLPQKVFQRNLGSRQVHCHLMKVSVVLRDWVTLLEPSVR